MDIVPLTIWREARGEGPEGMLAVACVIRNRASKPKWWNADPERVCLQRRQFSCWNDSDANRDLYPSAGDAPTWTQAVNAWKLANDGQTADPTNGACFYCNPAACFPRNPFDNEKFKISAKIGKHVFYVQV